MEDRGIWLHRDQRVENRGQNFVVHPDFPTCGFCSGFAFGDDRNHPLAHKANDVVENIGVVGVDQVILMRGGAEKATRNILPGKNLDNARDGQRRLDVDAADARVGMWRAQHLEVQQVVHRHIHRVTGLSRDDRRAERVSEARPAGLAGNVLFCGLSALKSVVDAAVTGAPAQIALQRGGQIRPSFAIERRGGHDHARSAKAALESLRPEKRLLHGMQIAIAREALNGRHVAVRRAESRNQAAMHRLPVEPDSASAAIAAVATFLDAEPAKVADKSSQTLARPRFGVEEFSVDLVSHKMLQVESSWRICSAK